MWKPNENLDDYIVKPTPEGTSDTPREVSLRATGEVEVLKPLTLAEIRATRAGFKASHQPLWFRRFVAVGSGALVMIGLVLVSAILVGINDPAGEPDVAVYVNPNDDLGEPEEIFSFDVAPPSTSPEPTHRAHIIRSNARRTTVRSNVRVAAVKPRQPLLRHALELEPKFIPTTLVIYAENGVINTRIEPWLQDSN